LTVTALNVNTVDVPGGITLMTDVRSVRRGMSQMFEVRVQTLEGKMDELLASNKRIEKILLGEPLDQSQVGLLMRMDRLERTNSGWARFLWMAAGVVLTATVAVLIQGA